MNGKSQLSKIFSRELRKRILFDSFENGKLPNVRELARNADLSVPTVLDSLRSLEQEGILYSRQGSGVYINDIHSRRLSITALKADYDSSRLEMFTQSVGEYCRLHHHKFQRFNVPIIPEKYDQIPGFSDVIVYVAPSHPLEPVWLGELDQRCGVLVIMDKSPDYLALDSIAPDGESMIVQALEYLYRNGHQKIWYIQNSPKVYDVIIRYYVAAAWAVERGIHLTHIDCNVAPGEDGGEKCRQTLLRELRNPETPPTALLTINEVGALMALRACRESNRSVPGDISIIGLNDSSELVSAEPPITTVSDLPSRFTEALDRLIQNKLYRKSHEHIRIKIPGVLIERESVKNISIHSTPQTT